MDGYAENKDLIQEIITIETIEETYITETFVTDSESEENLINDKSQVCLMVNSSSDRSVKQSQYLPGSKTNIQELINALPVANSTPDCTNELVKVTESDSTGIKLTESESLTVLTETTEKHSDIVISPVQPSPPVISVQNIIHTVVEAMDDFMNEDEIDFEEINEKIFGYQNISGDKLAKRQKRMRSGIHCAFKQIEDIEAILKTLESQCSANPLNHIKCNLLKIRGIVEEISLLSHRVGSTEKEVLIARDLWLLVRCLDELEVKNPVPKEYCDTSITAKETRNAGYGDKEDIEDIPFEIAPQSSERVPSFVGLCVASESTDDTGLYEPTPTVLKVTTGEKLADFCVQCFEYVEKCMEHPKLLLLILFLIFWLIKATGLLLFMFPLLCEDPSLYMPSSMEFNLRHYGLPPV